MSSWALLVLTVLLAGPSGVGAAAGNLEGAWLSEGTKWESPPTDTARGRFGYATVIYFGSDGTLLILECVVNRLHEHLGISHGDPQVVSLGTWRQKDDETVASFRLVERTVKLVGEQLPGTLEQVKVRRDRGGILRVNGKVYRRERGLDEDAAEITQAVRSRIR